MIGTLEPAPDRRNGASLTLTDVSTFRGPPLPCRVWQDEARGQIPPHRVARNPRRSDCHAAVSPVATSPADCGDSACVISPMHGRV